MSEIEKVLEAAVVQGKSLGRMEAKLELCQKVTALVRVLVAQDAMTERASDALGTLVDDEFVSVLRERAEGAVNRGEVLS